MKLQIHSVNFSIDSKLTDFLQKKMDKMETFYERIVGGEIFLRLNNERVSNKTIEIKLYVPGGHLFSKEKAASFEEAMDKAVEALKRQLKKFKGKKKDKRNHKKGMDQQMEVE